jgi:predicted HNH restriction endonuclease
MTNYYFVIINKEDYYRYGLFLGDALKSLDNKIWGQLESSVKDLWNTINENDMIIFGNEDFNFKNYSKVVKKSIIDRNEAKILFGTSFRAKELKYLLFFNNIYKTEFTFSEMKRFVGLKHNPEHGMFSISKISEKIFLEKFENKKQGKLEQIPFQNPDNDNKGQPKKTQRSINVFERDSSIVKKLKQQYDDFCQVCNYRIKKSTGGFYSEVHHFWPLQYGGDDDKKNMLVVCPNHHKEFDFCSIALLEDGISVMNLENKIIFTLKTRDGHKIDKKNINFHLNRFKEN